MRIDIVTLFPEMFAPLFHSILKRAQDNGTLAIQVHNPR
ncbi:MAG: tRNA (guanosine(37)-N1)-methyltransferase TrmD, partial [Bacillota bacterium]